MGILLKGLCVLTGVGVGVKSINTNRTTSVTPAVPVCVSLHQYDLGNV